MVQSLDNLRSELQKWQSTKICQFLWTNFDLFTSSTVLVTTCLGADPPPPPFGGPPSPPWLYVLFLEGIVTETEEKLMKHKLNYNLVTNSGTNFSIWWYQENWQWCNPPARTIGEGWGQDPTILTGHQTLTPWMSHGTSLHHLPSQLISTTPNIHHTQGCQPTSWLQSQPSLYGPGWNIMN